MSVDERERELGSWEAVIADPVRLQRLREQILVANLKNALWDANMYASRLDRNGPAAGKSVLQA
jgi:hypothetical protein